MKTVAGSLCFLLLTLLCFEAAGGDKDQDKKKRPYASATTDCDKAISGKKSSLAESYSSEVWTLKQRFQNDGDLEKALAADKEWSRSIRREPLTPEDLVESPKELRALQDAYVERQDGIEQEVAADVVRDLEREAKELAQAGNLTDGRVLQQEIDKIKRLYLSDTTVNAKGSSTTKSKKAAGKNTPEDPVAVCEEMIRQKRVALQAQYVGELEAMEKSFQAKGLLEDLFATKGERQRFLETPIIAEANLVETPELLQELQQKYLELQNNAATAVAEEFVSRLEQQKQAMTIEGNLDGALQAKKDAEKIRLRYSATPEGATGVPKLREGLLAYYLFEGNGRDSSGNGRDISLNNHNWVEGVGKGQAVHFRYTTAVAIPNSGALCRGPFSVVAWIRLDPNVDTNGKWPWALGKRVDFHRGTFGVQGGAINGQLQTFGPSFWLQDGESPQLRSKTPVMLGQWYFVAIAVSQQRITFFVDGKEASQCKASAPLLQSDSPVIIGGNGWVGPEQTWQGDIDNFRLYSRDVNAAEVRLMYEQDNRKSR